MIGKSLGYYQSTSPLDKSGIGEVFQSKGQELLRDLMIASAE
jgi:hypothetical protein